MDTPLQIDLYFLMHRSWKYILLDTFRIPPRTTADLKILQTAIIYSWQYTIRTNLLLTFFTCCTVIGRKTKSWQTVCVLQKAAVSAFAQMLRRYTGLNHLAQAARTVLQNKAQVNKMYQDLCKVDFVHIQVNAVQFSSILILIEHHF